VTTYAVDQQRMAQVTVRRLRSRMREGLEGPLRTLVGGWFVERDTVMDLNTHQRCGRNAEAPLQEMALPVRTEIPQH